MSDMNPWHPMKDPVDLKVMGKLNEEAGELVSVTARCIIQGVNQSHPVTGKPNREWLEDEIADALTGIDLAVERWSLDLGRIQQRRQAKTAQLREWHRMA